MLVAAARQRKMCGSWSREAMIQSDFGFEPIAAVHSGTAHTRRSISIIWSGEYRVVARSIWELHRLRRKPLILWRRAQRGGIFTFVRTWPGLAAEKAGR